MPLYNYICSKEECKTAHELWLSISDKDNQKCRTCGSLLIQQLSANPGYVKGTFTYTKCK